MSVRILWPALKQNHFNEVRSTVWDRNVVKQTRNAEYKLFWEQKNILKKIYLDKEIHSNNNQNPRESIEKNENYIKTKNSTKYTSDIQEPFPLLNKLTSRLAPNNSKGFINNVMENYKLNVSHVTQLIIFHFIFFKIVFSLFFSFQNWFIPTWISKNWIKVLS